LIPFWPNILTDIQPHRFKKDQRVRLLGEASNLYPMATALMEGWVRALDHDKFGYPVVFIEWDKTHWAYNGERDDWTFESHFEPTNDLEEEKVENPEQPNIPDILARMFAGAMENKNNESESSIGDLSDWPTRAELNETLDEAIPHAREADAVMVLTVRRDGDTLVPALATCFLNPEAALLLEAQLSRLGAIAHADAAAQLISILIDPKDS
jgi:hypothetical protein